MKRPVLVDPMLLDTILAAGPNAMPMAEKVNCLERLRAQSPEIARQTDLLLLERYAGLQSGLLQARDNLAKCQSILEKVTALPWHPALFLRVLETEAGPRAVVQHGSNRRVVTVTDELDFAALGAGDEVFLNSELNVIMAVSPDGPPSCGETALFDRKTEQGRLVLKWRDDELLVEAAASLAGTNLNIGESIRFDRQSWVAFEKIERAVNSEFLLADLPDLTRDQVGGQDENLETLFATLTTILIDPERAAQYRQSGRNSILMVGPPGCGKTLMAKVAASEISRLSGKKCRIAVVKPAAWESAYVGETQRNIRQFFHALGEAARGGCAIAFFDEVESIGRLRGGITNHHSDKFLAALLAELNGFQDRKDIAIIAATNRKDLVDPALLERLSEVEVPVGRPDLRAARAILRIHLPATLPFSPNGDRAAGTQEEIIETTLSRLYSPNADNSVCQLRFRDGKERTVHARELMSGRLLEQVCRRACNRAFLRDVRGGGAGLQLADMEDAIEGTLQRLRTLLTRHNAHAYLHDLPQDLDVVSVEPSVKRVSSVRPYLNLEPI